MKSLWWSLTKFTLDKGHYISVTSSEEGDVFWLTLDEMKQRKLAYGMDKMLEVFLNDNISEYFFFEENGKWIEELK